MLYTLIDANYTGEDPNVYWNGFYENILLEQLSQLNFLTALFE